MRVLQLCSKVPYPTIDGGCLAMYNMAMMLIAAGHELKTMAIATPKHPAPIEGFPEEVIKMMAIEAFEVNTKPNFFDGFKIIIGSSNSYVYSRFYNKDFEQQLERILHNYKPDLVLMESALMFNYFEVIKKFDTSLKIIYRSHNIENHIWSLLAKQTNNFFKKIYFRLEAKRISKYETKFSSIVDGIICISNKDRDFYVNNKVKKPLTIIPFTLDLKKHKQQLFNSNKNILHIGAMDYQPNIEGMKWFISKVWTKIFLKDEAAKFFIAGKAMPKDEIYYSNGIVNKGEVKNAIDFFSNASIVVVPLWSGAGLKVKIIEAMALGKTVITTPHGLLGTNATPNENILIAKNANEFLTHIFNCWQQPELVKQIGENAKKFIEENFSLTSKIEALQQFIKLVKTN